ncbi:MAG: hypothetical protein GXP62_03135 [Oligoflexia bacterium]|nr:hypothetical protein [Oligoflexia bacterium]
MITRESGRAGSMIKLLLWSGMLGCGLLGCVPKGDAATAQPGTVPDNPPTISNIEWGCDVDLAQWSFLVDTAYWSGGAYLWLATDAKTWERHTIYSQAAAADGSTDQLGASLDVVTDWRDAVSGSSTRFRCQDEADLAFQVTIYDRYGTEATDCQRWGVDGVLDEIGDVFACP